jgi:tRNA-Thr(GGU) m(6)t(6)A37 methyltransferase TsaA
MSTLVEVEDRKLLKRILALGHDLERAWPAFHLSPNSEAFTPLPSDEALQMLGELKTLITACTNASSEDLRRLAFHSDNLSPAMSARHLVAILVPFERLQSRALRDDEFLVSEQDATEAQREVAPFKVIADNLRSAFNVGALFRTAECFGAEEVLLSGYTATPQDEKTARTSMGTQEHIPWRTFTHARDALEAVRAEGYTIVALETVEKAESLESFEWPEKCALLVGNERFGVDHATLAQADHLLRIPVYGRKNSLNVGIAFGIAVADWRRKLEQRRAHEALQVHEAKHTPHAAHGSRTDGPQGISTAPQGTPTPPLRLRPIGHFHSSSRFPYEARRQGAANETEQTGFIELTRGRQFEQALSDLDGFERVWLIYGFHLNEHWHPKVMPPRGARIKRGVFATRSPYRPNPIGLSSVELVKIEGLKVHVRGFDLLDGTPIYDIKPYLPYADAFPTAKTGWLEGIEERIVAVEFSPTAEMKLHWLEDHGVSQMRGFIRAQLEYEPLDTERKRVTPSPMPEAPHRLAYRTWRADFYFDAVLRRVIVENILSGYSATDLETSTDPYADKNLHRAFIAKFTRPAHKDS